MVSIMKVMLAVVALAGLTACQTTTAGGEMTDRADTRYVGIFMPVQNPALDQIVGDGYASEYFLPAWRAYESGRVSGASANVRLFLLNGQDQTTIYDGSIDGYRYVSIDRSQVQSGTQLCAEVPFRISHQRVAAGERTVCTVQGDLDGYLQGGNGRSPEDAFGAIAIAPPSYS